MRIALDARVIYAPHRRGIGRSLLRLYQEVARIRPDWRVMALHRKPDKPRGWEPIASSTLLAMPVGFWQHREVEMPGDRLDAWNRYRLPSEASRLEADVLHCPANACPSSSKVPMLVTIHDLIPLDHNDGQSAAEKRRYDGWMKNAVQRAAGILCVSQYTADALASRYAVHPDRVTVCPHGIDPAPQPTEEDLHRVTDRYPLDRPFLLHLGAAGPRKNTTRVLEAWSKVPRTLRESHRLLVVGLDTATKQTLSANLGPVGLRDSVSLCGFAAAEDLPVLMARAEGLVFASRAEGFGLPLLEAFAAGTPVITSDRTSLPEVAGEAALFVDPKDGNAIAKAMQKILTDQSLRSSLIEKGTARCEAFTWRHAAETFVQQVERVAQGASRPHRRRGKAA
ncbi:MAG: glycosyltransferase family 4 protein [Phycisphaeraceae bacterium]